MPTNLRDLLEYTPPQTAGVIPYFDGCNWTVIQIPAGITCRDVLSCIDCAFIGSLFNFSDISLVRDSVNCTLSVNSSRVNEVIMASFDCDTMLLTIGSNSIDLGCILNERQFSFTDGSASQVVTNLSTVTINGRDGLGFRIGNGGLNISLPNPRTDGQVLTWSDNLNQAIRANPMDVCCDRVQGCMSGIIAALQAEIAIIAQQLCPCAPGLGTPMVIYDEGFMVHNTSNMNFIGDGVSAVWNDITSTVDITFDGSGIAGIDVYDAGAIVATTTELNFLGCLDATLNGSVIDISFNGELAFNNITNVLSLCGHTVTLPLGGVQAIQWSNYEDAPVLVTNISDYGHIAFLDCVVASLPVITGIYSALKGRFVILENMSTSTGNITIQGAANVTVVSPVNGFVLVPGETALFLVTGEGNLATKYNRIS